MINLRFLAVMTLLFTGHAFAEQDIQFIGKIERTLPSQPASHAVQTFKTTRPTSITLLKVQLSNHAWTKLQARAQEQEAPMHAQIAASSETMAEVQLGMNNVPVRDQGPHGTCVTFANAAAVDAALERGDYTSELCQLQLGRYLEHNGYTMSGWNGSLGPVVLNQMQTFGVVSKNTQRTQGCAGFTEYPVKSLDEPSTAMSPEDYHAVSEVFSDGHVAWSPVLDMYQVFIDKTNPETTLEHVKKALNAGDRLTFGVLLFDTQQGIGGAVGTYRSLNDTWILTSDIIKAIDEQSDPAGHEMIITGYNDNAIVTDAEGHSHTGLLTLRNSWGERLGDKGDFYMSYDFFKTLTLEVQRIRSTG